MNSKIFSYKVDGIVLEPFDNNLMVSKNFDSKTAIDFIKEKLKEQNFKVEERSIKYTMIDKQLYLEGIAIEYQQPNSIGFFTGK
ncbi:MAG TPA: hypothetical protein DCO83_00935 [Mucilaginibacter sp.]|nr:hypothetical protein [Mucilaginibacter sp.]